MPALLWAAVKWLGSGLLAMLALYLLAVFAGWPWHSRWGATRQEASMPMPGDERTPAPRGRGVSAGLALQSGFSHGGSKLI